MEEDNVPPSTAMEKSEFRVLIKHYYFRGKTAKQTKDKLDKYYGSAAPSSSTVKKWMHDFRLGRTNTNNAARSGRPPDVTTPERIENIQSIITKDKSIKIRDIANNLQISTERVGNILREHLKLKKMYTRWVPRELTTEQKCQRLDICEKNIIMCKEEPKAFLQRYVNVDDIWLCYNKPNVEGTKALEVEKVRVTIAWSAFGLVTLYFLYRDDIGNEDEMMCLERLNESIERNNRKLVEDRKVLLHRDCVTVHKNLEATNTLVAHNFELLPHPADSPDLTPFQFYLYPDLKKWLDVRKFNSSKEIESELYAYFGNLGGDYFKKGIELLQSRWLKCVEVKGNYFEE